MAQARVGPGNKLLIGGAISPYAPAVVALMGNISISRTAPTIDTTSQDTVGGYKEFVPGLKDSAKVSGPLWFDANDTQHILLNTLFESGEFRYFEVQFAKSSPGKYFRFIGAITGFSLDMPVDGVISANFEVTVNGALTLV